MMMPRRDKLNFRRSGALVRAWLAAGVLVCAGCNGSGLDLAPVEGIVTYNGTPLADAGVLFKPAQGPFAMGVTDAEGRFTLTTANEEGAIIGDHQVAISKAETLVKYRPGHPMPIYQTKALIPQKYFDAGTSTLTATVADDDNEFKFDLTAK
jgi:hypothetical protein